jgi:hypothetical protein
MKDFTTYLMESTRQYVYKIKLAGDLPEGFMKKFEEELSRFDVEKVTSIKKTPVMRDQLDFPDLQNMDVSMFEVTLNYPATTEHLTKMAMECGMCETRIKMFTKDFADGWADKETKSVMEPEQAPILEKDYDKPSKEQKDSHKGYQDPMSNVDEEEDKPKFEVAGGKTPPAKTTNDLDMGVKSPVGSQKQKKPEPKSAAR